MLTLVHLIHCLNKIWPATLSQCSMHQNFGQYLLPFDMTRTAELRTLCNTSVCRLIWDNSQQTDTVVDMGGNKHMHQCGHPLPWLANNWTSGADGRHTTATRPSPYSS